MLRAGNKPKAAAPVRPQTRWQGRWGDYAWYGLLILIGIAALWKTTLFVLGEVTLAEVGHVVLLGFITLLRVAILIAIASLIWVPIGVWVGMRPRVASIVQPIAQFLAAFPANVLFPFAVSAIVILKLNPDIWLSPLMVLGTQWYILFNVIVGASGISADLRYAGENLGLKGWLWWKRLALPAIFPVLRHRRHHRLRRLLERQHRRRGGQLGLGEADRAWPGSLYCRGDHHGGLPAQRAGHGGPDAVRGDAEPDLLAPAVCAGRAQVPHELRMGDCT